jgi:microcystin-dependent protein
MEPFLGQIQAFGFNFAPRGWASCDGQLMPISQYQALYSLLGTIYGGDGRTSFGLPDLRGRFAIGHGNGPGLSPATLGAKGGANQVTLTVNNLPAHNHMVNGGISVGVSDEDANASEGNGKNLGGAQIYTDQASNGNIAGVSSPTETTLTGGGQPLSVVNPYQVVNVCIALQGLFPSRN